MENEDQLRLAIDIGGTFTDAVLMGATGQTLATTKVPTTPDTPAHGAISGAEQVLRQAGAEWGNITSFIHGTTLATNALIERRGARVATITNDGFRDILEIAYERRHSQYDIDIEKPDLIVPRHLAFTISGRIDAKGSERTPLAEAEVADIARKLREEKVEAVAVCLLHAYANPAHESRLRSLLQSEMPGLVISLSHEVSPEAREFDRLCTTIANSYIQPLMAGYLADIRTEFCERGLRCPILMMTASGGMTTLETAAHLPIRLVESGPAGGAILAARIAAQVGAEQVLSFDMGGTTAKLCLIDDFRPQSARKFEIARAERFTKGSGMPVRIPVTEMIEIGAGGGSIAALDTLGRVTVGPQSAGAEPGPAGFGKGGTDATVTDADILQGYILPERFAEGRLRIIPAASEQAMQEGIGTGLGTDAGSAASAVSEIVDEAMAAAGRMHAVESGKDLSTRVMIAFGGNGPLHATRVARRAGVERIMIPPNPGVGSAVGFLFAPVSFEIIRSHYVTLDDLDAEALARLFENMQHEAESVVRSGARDVPLTSRRVGFMRYKGQGHEIEINLGDGPLDQLDVGVLEAAFAMEYSRQFGRVVPGMTVEVLNWGLVVATETSRPKPQARKPQRNLRRAEEKRELWCNVTRNWRQAGVFERAALAPGDSLVGPALIVEPQTTTFVSADFCAEVDDAGNIWLIQETETDP